ncbi:hypothetical protein BT63DRAFT_476647 [Microthyrium microscopicum]|uniref:Programmed cell death protein 2 C-terminal domain-containing protein n=1 Tax=Microthyrium microscopicum TaxID=703497 RepID=A0A6A6UJB7_9PEZI|nr:hypothetical protein BT63DRAFT_476647 [Microthyrium microscopicum]
MDYDSDSSAGEDQPYTETLTLLGYASKEPTDDSTSHLGGTPTWLDSKTTPSGSLAKCKVCNDNCSLLLQLNGDLPSKFPGHERWLYIFACRRKPCRRKDGSIRAMRGNRISKVAPTPSKPQSTPEPAKPSINVGAQLFGVSSSTTQRTNPFATSTAVNKANPFAATPFATAAPTSKPSANTDSTTSDITTLPETFASKARLSTPPPSHEPPHEPWPTLDQLSAPFPHYHLDADYETLSAPPTPKQSLPTIDTDSSGGGTSGRVEDLFESSMDKTFQKFADRMAQNPEQVLRYEFGGAPVLYSNTDAVGKLLTPSTSGEGKLVVTASEGSRMPRCTRCGAQRVFEVQLTPHAITELEEEEMGVDGMEWGTVIVGVCGVDCALAEEGNVGYGEEWVGVQWEEVQKGGR